MFKSIFGKYISVFMAIIILSFAVIIAIITSIINGYSQNAKEDIMKTSAVAASSYMSAQIEISGKDSLSSFVQEYKSTAVATLSSANSTSEDITLILCDTSGKIFASFGANSDSVLSKDSLPSQFMDYFKQENEFFELSASDDIFDEPHILLAEPIVDSDAKTIGYIFACSTTVILSSLLREIVKLIILAILWVMLATLIAVSIISERIISPLRQISRAAKSFAAGKFDVRVPVKGHDEITELAIAFNNMAESLDNYEKMRNSFISNVSHDLRTPMTSISGFIDGILDGVIPPQKHKYYLQIVSNEVKRLSRLVVSLLDISKIQAGERKFTMVPFDICEMARKILFSFESKINDKKLDIQFDFEEDNITVIADSDATYQVLYNLCDNAVKFASEGGILRISVKRTKNRRWTVGVYNEGEGISQKDIPHVFERFYKSDKSRGLDKSGVGLGLFISKTIVEAHGESISVESEHGKNCFFSFTVKGQ